MKGFGTSPQYAASEAVALASNGKLSYCFWKTRLVAFFRAKTVM